MSFLLIALFFQVLVNPATMLKGDDIHAFVAFLDFKDDTPIADPGVSLSRDHLQTFRYAAIIGIVGHLLQALPNTADGSSIQAL